MRYVSHYAVRQVKQVLHLCKISFERVLSFLEHSFYFCSSGDPHTTFLLSIHCDFVSRDFYWAALICGHCGGDLFFVCTLEFIWDKSAWVWSFARTYCQLLVHLLYVRLWEIHRAADDVACLNAALILIEYWKHLQCFVNFCFWALRITQEGTLFIVYLLRHRLNEQLLFIIQSVFHNGTASDRDLRDLLKERAHLSTWETVRGDDKI